jgi:hypothetical protein
MPNLDEETDPSIKPEALHCELCKVYASDLKLLMMHFTGLKHLEKLRKLEPEERKKYEEHHRAKWPATSQPSTLTSILGDNFDVPANLNIKLLPVSLDSFLISALTVTITEALEMYEAGRVSCPSLEEGLKHWAAMRQAAGSKLVQYNKVVEASILPENEFKARVYREFQAMQVGQ